MLRCFSNPKSPTNLPSPPPLIPSSSSSSSSQPPQNSATSENSDETLSSNSNVNLTREYTLAVQTNSYNEIWSRIHTEENEVTSAHLITQVLHPNQQQVDEALGRAKPNKLTHLVSSYFDNSEHTSHFCLQLHRSIDCARSLYAPLHDLLDVLPMDSVLAQPQCDRAFEIFSEFDHLENPFPNPNSNNFHEIRGRFSNLKQQLDRHLRKARKRVRLHRRTINSSAFCLIGTAVGVAVSAVAIASHAIIALIAYSPLLAFLPPNFAKKQLDHISQLDAAAKGTYVLNNELSTIHILVARLHSAVESDKVLIRFGLERGRDKYLIQEVLKQLHKNQPNFLHLLKDLDEHVCLCFITVNRARSLLLEEIHLHQACNS